MSGRVVVLRGDAAHLPLPDGSVDLIVTSPPYFGQRDYRDGGESLKGQIGNEETPREYVDALLACTREWMRVLKPEGSIFVNLGDKYNSAASNQQSGAALLARRGAPRAAGQERATGGRSRALPDVRPKTLLGLPARYTLGCMDDLGLIVRRDIIWHKLSAQPESVTDRCATRHEYLFHLVKQPRYFAASQTNAANPPGKLPGSVWEIAAIPLVVPARIAHACCCQGFPKADCGGLAHYAAFPFELPRRCILGWSPPSALVADPFGGTGTTALVASMLGRDAATFDLSADYCRLARWRTADPAERARALGVPKPPPVPDGQGDLFELGEAS